MIPRLDCRAVSEALTPERAARSSTASPRARDELVALLCDLIRFDTHEPLGARTSPRATRRRCSASSPAGCEAAGASVDVWEPARGRGRGPSALPRGRHRLRGPPAAGRALQGRGRRALAALQRPHRRRARAARGRLGAPTRSTRRSRDGRVDRPRRVRHEGRDRRDGRRRRGAGRRGRARAATSSCARTRTRSPAASAASPARATASAADFAIVTEPSCARGLARVPRLRLLLGRGAGPRRAHRAGARELPRRRRGQRDREGAPPARRRRPPARGVAQPARRPPPAARPARHRRQPARRRRGLARHDPRPRGAHARRADPARAGRRRRLDQAACARRSRASCGRWCAADPWLARAPADVHLAHGGQPVRDARRRRRACRRCSAPTRRSACRPRSAGSAPGTTARPTRSRPARPRSCTARARIDRAHTVGEWVPIADLVACAQGLALAAWRLCR